MIAQLEISTRSRAELVDITAAVQRTVREKGMQSGVCHIFVPHTTAGLTLNESGFFPDSPGGGWPPGAGHLAGDLSVRTLRAPTTAQRGDASLRELM